MNRTARTTTNGTAEESTTQRPAPGASGAGSGAPTAASNGLTVVE